MRDPVIHAGPSSSPVAREMRHDSFPGNFILGCAGAHHSEAPSRAPGFINFSPFALSTLPESLRKVRRQPLFDYRRSNLVHDTADISEASPSLRMIELAVGNDPRQYISYKYYFIR
jgi:hypothetical protein